jgi:hypothetical protein
LLLFVALVLIFQLLYLGPALHHFPEFS